MCNGLKWALASVNSSNLPLAAYVLLCPAAVQRTLTPAEAGANLSTLKG